MKALFLAVAATAGAACLSAPACAADLSGGTAVEIVGLATSLAGQISDGVAIAQAIVAPQTAVAAVPEPASWMMMIGGFGLIGGALRRRKVSFA